jgi:hypothetical protein
MGSNWNSSLSSQPRSVIPGSRDATPSSTALLTQFWAPRLRSGRTLSADEAPKLLNWLKRAGSRTVNRSLGSRDQAERA